MIGLVIVAHGNLAKEYHNVIEHIVGEQPQLASYGIDSDFCAHTQKEEIQSLLKKHDSGDGVLIVTDMLGATPCNIAISSIVSDHVKMVTGANVPMLVKLMFARQNLSVEELSNIAQKAGQKHIYTCEDICCKISQNNLAFQELGLTKKQSPASGSKKAPTSIMQTGK